MDLACVERLSFSLWRARAQRFVQFKPGERLTLKFFNVNTASSVFHLDGWHTLQTTGGDCFPTHFERCIKVQRTLCWRCLVQIVLGARVRGAREGPCLVIIFMGDSNSVNHKNSNFLDSVIGFKNSHFPLQVVIGQCIIGHLVIGQFSKPITFKVVVKIHQSHLKF